MLRVGELKGILRGRCSTKQAWSHLSTQVEIVVDLLRNHTTSAGVFAAGVFD
jgi:hypothetical protein